MGTTHTIGTPAPSYAGGRLAQGGTLGLLGNRSAMNAISTTNYTSQLIQDQQARTAADTLINNASVRASTGQNGFDDTLQIRGFPVPAGDIGLNGLYGLVSSNRVPSYFVERIELLLGPGALINGIAPGGSVGGAVNIVTKRAGEIPFTRVTPFFMSAGSYGLHLENSGRYGANKEWGVRFNGVGRNGEASINDGNSRIGSARWGSTIAASVFAGRLMRSHRTRTPEISVRRWASRLPCRSFPLYQTRAATGIPEQL